MLIGVTGLTDSGKEEILKIITGETKDFIIINTSKIYSLLFNNQFYIDELLKTFGKDVLDRNRKITRDSLNVIMSRGSENTQKLHKIITKYGSKIIQDIQDSHPVQTYIILDIGLLLNYGLVDICDKVIIPIATKETRAKRLSERTKISYEEALKRVSLQRALSYHKNNCFYITTDGSIDTIMKQKIVDFVKR